MRTKTGSSHISLSQLLGMSEEVSTPLAGTPLPGHCAHTLQGFDKLWPTVHFCE